MKKLLMMHRSTLLPTVYIIPTALLFGAEPDRRHCKNGPFAALELFGRGVDEHG